MLYFTLKINNRKLGMRVWILTFNIIVRFNTRLIKEQCNHFSSIEQFLDYIIRIYLGLRNVLMEAL